MYEKYCFENSSGQGFHYLKYIPKDAGSSEKLPLLIFLHGYGERGPVDGSEVERVAKHGYFKNISNGEDFPFIMVAPQCPDIGYWGGYIESLNKFLDHIIAENNVDTDRIYLTGLSMGGTGTWMLAMAAPSKFAAIAPICGSGICWYVGILEKTPIMVYHGDCDDVVPIQNSVDMVSFVNKRGGNAQMKIFLIRDVPSEARPVFQPCAR